MNKLIWRLYNEEKISVDVANELLEYYYQRKWK